MKKLIAFFLLGLFIVFLATKVVANYVMTFEYVTGESMSPQISSRSLGVVVKSAWFKETDLKRGEIYVVHPFEGFKFVKRLIGFPGDTVWIENGKVYLNDNIYETHFYAHEFAAVECRFSSHYEVPQGHYFFLGDNLCNSNDSRFWGTIPFSRIKGKYAQTIFTFK